jgi:hypothetical protein
VQACRSEPVKKNKQPNPQEVTVDVSNSPLPLAVRVGEQEDRDESMCSNKSKSEFSKLYVLAISIYPLITCAMCASDICVSADRPHDIRPKLFWVVRNVI